MRSPRFAILLVAVPLVLAGCALKGESTTTTTTSTGPTSGTSTTTTSTPPTSPTAPPPPTTNGSVEFGGVWTHDFQDPPKTQPFTIPPNATRADVWVQFQPGGTGMPSCAAPDAYVLLRDPSGAEFVNLSAGTGMAPCRSTRLSNVTLQEGAWNVRFEGTGDVSAWVSVLPSGGGTGGGNGTTPPQTGRFNVNATHDYAGDEENITLTIPPGYEGRLNVSFGFKPGVTPAGTLACVGPLRIDLYTPSGARHVGVLTLQVPNAEPTTSCGVVFTQAEGKREDIVAGDWHAAFTGSGVGIGYVRISTDG